jgi:hypothetical protein
MVGADTPRPSVTIIPVIDVSSSMTKNSLEGMKDLVRIEYSRLKMVQYSLSLVIKLLDANDVMASVKLGTTAQVVMARTQMTPEGKDRATQVVEGVVARGRTNL